MLPGCKGRLEGLQGLRPKPRPRPQRFRAPVKVCPGVPTYPSSEAVNLGSWKHLGTWGQSQAAKQPSIIGQHCHYLCASGYTILYPTLGMGQTSKTHLVPFVLPRPNDGGSERYDRRVHETLPEPCTNSKMTGVGPPGLRKVFQICQPEQPSSLPRCSSLAQEPSAGTTRASGLGSHPYTAGLRGPARSRCHHLTARKHLQPWDVLSTLA